MYPQPEYEYKDELICPYCGTKETKPERLHSADGDENDIECSHCGETYTVSYNITMAYTAYKKGGVR